MKRTLRAYARPGPGASGRDVVVDAGTGERQIRGNDAIRVTGPGPPAPTPTSELVTPI